MILEVLKYPAPELRYMSRPVTQFDENLKELVYAMVEAMNTKGGIGLAAPQVGVCKRVIIVSDGDIPMVMVNPEILSASNEMIEWGEGCLSLIKGYTRNMERHRSVDVEYQDMEGALLVGRFENLMSLCVQHEIDHLDGRLITDYDSIRC